MENKEQTIVAILRYLGDQKSTGKLEEQQIEDLQVVVNSLEKIFGVAVPEGNADTVQETGPDQLLANVHGQGVASDGDGSRPALSSESEPSALDKQEAERLKTMGNDFMKAEKYAEAVHSYTQAIENDGSNAVYYCNRAAAYSKLKEHQKSLEDCVTALNIDPSYSKAYGRMGIAHTDLENQESALACYRKALELDPDNPSNIRNLELATKKLRETGGACAEGSEDKEGQGQGVMDFITNPHFIMNLTKCLCDPKMQQICGNFVAPDSATRISAILQGFQLLVEYFGKPNQQPKASHNQSSANLQPPILQLLTAQKSTPPNTTTTTMSTTTSSPPLPKKDQEDNQCSSA